MGIVGKARYYTGKYVGSLAESYGYDPSKRVPTAPPAPAGYEYVGTTEGKVILVKEGGGAGYRPEEVVSSAIAEAERKQAALTIERERRSAFAEANKEYRESLRKIHDIQGRQVALNKMQEKIAQAETRATAKRVEAGIVVSGVIPTTEGRLKVTRETAKEIRERIEGRPEAAAREPELFPTAPTIIKLPPTKLERVKWAAREYYTRLFEPEPSYSLLTVRKIAADVPQAFLITAPEYTGKLAGKGAEIAAKKIGVKEEGYPMIIKEQVIPQKVTIGGEFKIPKQEIRVLSPMEIGKGAEAIGTIAPYTIAPATALFLGGLAIATGPREPYRPVEKRIEAGIIAGVGAGMLGYKAYKRITKPIITYKPYKTPEPTFKEVQLPVRYKGKEIRVAGYKITQRVPSVEAEVTTPFRKFFGMKPKLPMGPITYPKTIITYTPEIVIGKKPFITVEKGFGKYARKAGVIAEISGRQVPTSLKSFEKLPAREQFLWQKLAERITGRPVAMENVPKMLKKDIIKVKSYITTEKIFKIEPSKAKMEWVPPGKRVTRAEVVSVIEPIKTPEEAYKLYKAKLAFKDVTYPFARARGKVPTMKGVILELPPVEIPPAEKLPVKIKPAFKEAPLITKQVVKITPAPKIIPKAPKIKAPEIVPAEITVPTYVAGIKITAPKEIIKATAVEAPTVKRIIKPAVKPAIKEAQIVRPRERIETVTKIKAKIIPAVKEIAKAKEVLKKKEALKEKQILKLKEILKLKQIQKIGEILRPRVKYPIKPPIPPPIPPPIIYPSTPSLAAKPALASALKKIGYKAWVRRYGKWKPIKVFPTKEEAQRFAAGIITTGLGASLKVTKGEKPVSLELGRMFRPAKREAGVYVQKAEFRLSHPGEVAEIMRAKKIKGRWI